MIVLGILLLTHMAVLPAAARTFPFELGSNKPFVQVRIDGSAPQWFILDTGNQGGTLIALECADRLGLEHGTGERGDMGAGTGAEVRLATGRRPAMLECMGETLSVASPLFVTLGHVASVEGRRLDGSLGADYISRHVVEIDYATRRITIHDPSKYAPPPGATVVPLELETGWPVVKGIITTRDGVPIPCRLIIDTGVRFPIALFRPFSERNRLYDLPGGLTNAVVGAGVGGFSRGDVVRLDTLALGPVSLSRAVAVMSRDTSGIFALDGPDGIVGGELLRRYRTTFDYAHRRLILEPYRESTEFEWDMSGLFLAMDAPELVRLRVASVLRESPASKAGLRKGDEIVSIDGRRPPTLTLDEARGMLRTPIKRRLEIRRDGRLLRMSLEARRLV